MRGALPKGPHKVPLDCASVAVPAHMAPCVPVKAGLGCSVGACAVARGVECVCVCVCLGVCVGVCELDTPPIYDLNHVVCTLRGAAAAG